MRVKAFGNKNLLFGSTGVGGGGGVTVLLLTGIYIYNQESSFTELVGIKSWFLVAQGGGVGVRGKPT